MTQKNNPIKHVKFSESDYFKPNPNGGGNIKDFKKVTPDFIEELVSSINRVMLDLEQKSHYLDGVSGAAVVELEEKAIAKSHRPTKVFNDRTCPFFGDIGFARFLIEITPDSIKKLSARILNANSKSLMAELSAIKSIQAYKPELLINGNSRSLSIKLFRFGNREKDLEADIYFEQFLNEHEVKWKKHPSEVLRIYQVKAADKEFINHLLNFSVVSRVVSSDSVKLTPMVLSELDTIPPNAPTPDDKDYPVVAVVDTGVNAKCPYLEPWIIDVEEFVAIDRDFTHGSFVGGLISNAKNLNGMDTRFPSSQSKILSVEVLGSNGGDYFEIIEAMYEVANKHPLIKVWNLSLGESLPVSMLHISDMALMLDEFQEKNNCLCVVSAGNYEGSPREWPPTASYEDGISSPGDSVRCVTVGSLAHVDGFVKTGEPSHFSRKGPVSNYIQKPDVVHYGGNAVFQCNPTVILGVNSVSENSQLAQNIGTSFSTPLVSTIAADLFHRIGSRATPSLVKSLLVHSASLTNSISDENRHYYGTGIPEDAVAILSASEHEMTVVLEGKAKKSFEIQKLPFPIPDCLRTEDGKVRAEFFITLVYDSPLDTKKAFEYCQVNLDVGLGEVFEDGKFRSKVPLNTKAGDFEKDRVKNGNKWSPVKVYKKRFPQGINVDNWKLRVAMTNREGFEPEGELVPFSLVITLRDLDGIQPVYNDMSQLMDQHNWEVSNLVIEQKLRV